MFCDLVGSTALSTRLDPEDLRAVINAYHRCCTELVERNSGFVAKYMGDGVLAYFGYPRASEHDAEHAVRAGLALVEAVPKLATAARSPLQVRVGIGTGLVVVGDLIGTGAAQEQAVVGETPNLAARLQAAADPSAVVIGPTTRRLLGNLFDCRDLGGIEVKGFAAPVQAYQVLGAGTTESRFEALRTANTPLVGRDEEMELLLRRWEQARRGEGQVVLICGEPGIGKSRIAQTIVERISSEPHTRLRYFCSPHHQDSALYPSIAQLERAAGFRREDTPEERLAKLEAVLAQGANDLTEAVPLLADLLSIPTGDRYLPLNLSPQKRKERTLHTQLTQVEGLAAHQPVLMVFEDVQWIDPSTRELLDLLIDRVPSLRVLMIITFRPEFAPPWIGRPQVTILHLNRLPPRPCAEMITSMIGGKTLPKEIADQIVGRTDGVPLFIEELTKAVVESGLLADAGDRYALAGPIAPLAIPTSLHASLLARLDRLAPTRGIAQIGAAIGRSFSYDLIRAVSRMPQQRLDEALDQLVDAELIFRRGTPPHAEYTFKHALVQDAAYGTLLRSTRQQLHARIVAILEDQFPEIVAAHPGLLAQHCAEAGFNEKAIGYYLKTGQHAIARSAMAEAVAQLQKGIKLLTNLPDSSSREQYELDLQMPLGQALLAAKGYSAPEVGETIARARALAEQFDRSDHIVTLRYAQWVFHMVRAEHKIALSSAADMERFGTERSDTAAQLLGRFCCGVSHYLMGDFVLGRSVFRQCHGLSDPDNRRAYAAVTAEDPYTIMLTYSAANLAYLGYIDQARAELDKALSEARRLAHAHTLAMVLAMFGWMEWPAGSLESVKRHAEELVALSREHGFPFWELWGTLHLGWSLTRLGQAEEGLSLLSRGLSVVRVIGAAIGTPLVLTAMAEACAKLGRPTEAKNYLTEAAQHIENTDERYAEAESLRARGDLLLTDDPLAAERSYRQAIVVAKQQQGKIFELRAATSLARLWRDQGKLGEARDLLTPVYGWFTEGFDTLMLQEAKALLDELSASPTTAASMVPT
jgi:class 3 adenylate cyclase/predicted ATPase